MIRRLAFQCVLLAVWMTATGLAATTAQDYAERLRKAESATDDLIESDPSAPPEEVIATMRAVQQLLPAREAVEMDGQTIQVNNDWLHEAINLVIKNARGDEEQLRSMLVEVADRLFQLEQRVSAAQKQESAAKADQARLDRILARSEYAPEETKESFIQQWLRTLRDRFFILLARIFGGKRNPSASTVSLIRVLIALFVLAAASFGLVKLIIGLRTRRKKKADDDVREVLGEELDENVTADDLLKNANELARQGDFRSAIRRAYIALLCELEQRGKVQLHRAKTNRDYLDELKPQRSLYPTFSVMTGAFEHVWYGHELATESEFNDFITLYQETVR